MGSRRNNRARKMGRGRFVGATAGGLLLIAAAGLPAVNSLGAAPQPPFTPAERAAIGSLALAACRRCRPIRPTASPTIPAAAALGATLFFDQRLSRQRQGGMRHLPQDRPPVPGRSAARRRAWAPPTGAPCRSPAWPGSAGSSGTAARTACGRRRSRRWKMPPSRPATAPPTLTSWPEHFGQRYERIFGPMPDLGGCPPMPARSARRPSRRPGRR